MNEKHKITVVHVLECLTTGGREKVTVELMNGLAEHSFDVHVVLLSNNNNELISSLNKCICVHCLPISYKNLGGPGAIIFWVRAIFLLPRLFRKLDPDIIHTHLLFQQLLLASISKKIGAPEAKHFQTVHTAGLYFSKKSFINNIRLQTEKLAISINKSYIVAIADPVYQLCIKHFKKYATDIRRIYNGIDILKFDYRLRDIVKKEEYGFSKEDIIVTYVARMDEGKDHITLLKAWKTVIRVSAAKLLLIGDGVLKNSLQKFVSDNKLSDTVFFEGSVNFVNRILAITDIGVFPSLFEGFGVALVEKMIMKTPVIVTNIPTNSVLVREGESGFFFEPKDHEELATKLLWLIQEKAVRIQMGENAYKTVRVYTQESMVKNHISYYQNAISD